MRAVKLSIVQLLFVSGIFIASLAEAALVSPTQPQQSRFRVTNQCPDTIWIQQDFKSHTSDPIVVKIPSGQSYDYSVPNEGLPATRFWPKMGCNEHGYQCSMGESTAVPEAIDNGWQKPPFAPDINSKFEATWGCMKAIFDNNRALCAANPSDPGNSLGTETWWNGSAVDGYTLPYAVNVINHQNSCLDLHQSKVITDPGVNCGGLKASMCPTSANISTNGQFNAVNGLNLTAVNLQWLSPVTNEPVGCFSPCAKLTTAQGSEGGSTGGGWKYLLGDLVPESPEARMYCCPTPPITPEACSNGPIATNDYVLSVSQEQGCNAYTYAYDDAKGLARCGGQTQFELVFCPAEAPVVDEKQMTFIVPQGVQPRLNGQTIANQQASAIKSLDVLSLEGQQAICTLTLENVTLTGDGALCASIQIDNQANTITFTQAPVIDEVPSFTLQVNYNPAFQITAMLNQIIVNNAEKLSSTLFSPTTELKAFQGEKSASCALVLSENNITRGEGELCARLNIVKEGNSHIHIYLPADIPNMQALPPPAPIATKYIVFGMDPSMYADFLHHRVLNGTKIALDTFAANQQIQLVAYQNHLSATCLIGKVGNTLHIIQHSGLLCDNGLVVQTDNAGDYFIGLPHPLPVASPSNGQTFALGIAAGMSIRVGDQLVRWDSRDKNVVFNSGVTPVQIIGNNGLVRHCPISLNGQSLSWPNVGDCVGVVVHGNVLYFPAF